jgi:hypothetical protein
MSRSITHAIEQTAAELDPHSLLKPLGVSAPSFGTWKAGSHDARTEKAEQILLMLDRMRCRQAMNWQPMKWIRSLFLIQ